VLAKQSFLVRRPDGKLLRIPFWNRFISLDLRQEPGRIELENFEITRTMSNFEQTPNRDAAKFLSDVGGMHTMPEQKRFRGRHRV
jgi:hypothetical protein